MISLEDCKHKHLYLIHSRNLAAGIFDQNSEGFSGIRVKWGDEYIFEEYHWETGAPFGTVSPYAKICEYNHSLSDRKVMFHWLQFVKYSANFVEHLFYDLKEHPENRKPSFTWEKFPDMAARQAKTKSSLAFPSITAEMKDLVLLVGYKQAEYLVRSTNGLDGRETNSSQTS